MGVVGISRVLDTYTHCVVPESPVAKVIILEVSCRFVESVKIRNVMHSISDVERVHNGSIRVDVGSGVKGGILDKLEAALSVTNGVDTSWDTKGVGVVPPLELCE